MKKWIKITLIAAAVLAVLIVIAAIAVSPVAKNYIEKHDRERSAARSAWSGCG